MLFGAMGWIRGGGPILSFIALDCRSIVTRSHPYTKGSIEAHLPGKVVECHDGPSDV
jgi:hypothetical protein